MVIYGRCRRCVGRQCFMVLAMKWAHSVSIVEETWSRFDVPHAMIVLVETSKKVHVRVSIVTKKPPLA